MSTTKNTLNTKPNIEHIDDVYEHLIAAHAALSDVQSTRLNAKLILLLINHIGDEHVIIEAIDAAKPD